MENLNSSGYSKINFSLSPIHCIIEADEELGGLYLGDYDGAANYNAFPKYNIKSVLTCVTGIAVNYPKGVIESRMILNALDTPSYDMKQHFEEAIDFIHKNRQKGFTVLVHCDTGISPAPTIV